MSSNETLSSMLEELRANGFLPNGAQQLVYGSLVMRRQQQFHETGWKPTEEVLQDLGEYNRQFAEWAKGYDGFSGDNLAATAYYQHRMISPDDERFPDPKSPDFGALIEQMTQVGELMRSKLSEAGWQSLSAELGYLDRAHYANE